MEKFKATLSALVLALLTMPLLAQAKAEQIYSKLPAKEVTIFKNGYSFVLHEGTVQTNSKGNVVLDQLPQPIMGAFWAYSTQSNAKLTCVISSQDKEQTKATAASLTDLLKVNPHRQVLIKEHSRQQHYQATLIKLLDKQLVLAKLAEGTKAIPIGQIQTITFLEDPCDSITKTVTKETLTLKFDQQTEEPGSQVHVGMAYIQKGMRWIPNYRVEIDGQGNALIKLQGTIINELADLQDVTAHLVIGVPRFAFKDTPDPISFQETIAQLSHHFNPNSATAYAFSNAIRTQARHAEMGSGQPVMDSGPQLDTSEATEDLFVFDLNHVTLKKGQRMVIPIVEYTIPYTDIYTVDLPFAPPLEMRRKFNTEQHLKLARLFHAPKAIHKIRLKNDAEYPLTTAPATIFKNARVLAQGMMTYTSIGGTGDLEITTAVNITVKNSETQVKTTPDAVKWNGDTFAKVDMMGTIDLTNLCSKPVVLHVKRSVLGNVDEVTGEGTIRQLGHGYDGYVFESGVPFWWNWCRWPWWWYRFNSIGQAEWKIELGHKEHIKLQYNWHYFWT